MSYLPLVVVAMACLYGGLGLALAAAVFDSSENPKVHRLAVPLATAGGIIAVPGGITLLVVIIYAAASGHMLR